MNENKEDTSNEPEHIGEVIGKMQEDQEPIIEDAGSLPVKKKTGGAMPGAGRPKGPQSLAKRTKAEAKERFIERVQQNVDTLFAAQLSLAKGEQHLFVKYHTGEGKDRRAHIDIVTDPELISEYLTDNGYTLNQESDDEYYYISTRPANNQAIDSLLNRAFGKAPEKIEIEGGFFKANNLKIEIVQPKVIENIEEGEIIEHESESTDDNDAAVDETESSPSAS